MYRDPNRVGWIKEILNGNEVLGCFGQSELQRKKNHPTAISNKYATFLGVFFNFLWAKKT